MADPSFLHFAAEAVQVDPVRFARLPESARRVFGAVREQGPLTASQLRERTAMPPRTVRHAVARLKAEGLLDTRCSLRDCRTCYFFVSRRCLGVGAERFPPAENGSAPLPITLKRTPTEGEGNT